MKLRSSCSCILFSFSDDSFFLKKILIYTSDGTLLAYWELFFIASARFDFQKVSNFILGWWGKQPLSNSVHRCVCCGNFLYRLQSFLLIFNFHIKLTTIQNNWRFSSYISVQFITYLGKNTSTQMIKQKNHKESNTMFSEHLMTSYSCINNKTMWATAVYKITSTSRRSYKYSTLWIVLFMQ